MWEFRGPHDDFDSAVVITPVYELCFRRVSIDGKRKRSSFNDVQSRALRATELAEENSTVPDYTKMPFQGVLGQSRSTLEDVLKRCSGLN